MSSKSQEAAAGTNHRFTAMEQGRKRLQRYVTIITVSLVKILEHSIHSIIEMELIEKGRKEGKG